jgi:hypothetical protein
VRLSQDSRPALVKPARWRIGARLPSGVDWNAQERPFQCMMRVLPRWKLVAHALLSDVAVAPLRTVLNRLKDAAGDVIVRDDLAKGAVARSRLSAMTSLFSACSALFLV